MKRHKIVTRNTTRKRRRGWGEE